MNRWLIAEWRGAWRWWSVRMAGVAAIVAGVLTDNPGLLLGLIAMLPHGIWRTVTAAAVALVVFAIPTLLRLWNQGEKQRGNQGGRADG